MQGLNNLIKMGKVLYLGISDTPAWVISKANQYARDHGLSPFVSQTRGSNSDHQVVYQGRWSAAARDIERDILPMCISEGLGIAPWGALGQGRFQRKAHQGVSKDGRSSRKLTDKELQVGWLVFSS